jgi:hypothetical protein
MNLKGRLAYKIYRAKALKGQVALHREEAKKLWVLLIERV